MGCYGSSPTVSSSLDPKPAERTSRVDNPHLIQHPPPSIEPLNNNPQLINPQIKPSSMKHQEVMVSTEHIKKAEEIINGFDIARVMKEKLENVAHTPDQL